MNSKNDNGHALKVFNASENLAYGCWDDGLYRYGGYYGNGAPSDWAGIMLVSTIYINGEVNGYLKVAWDMSMSQYIMKRQQVTGDPLAQKLGNNFVPIVHGIAI